MITFEKIIKGEGPEPLCRFDKWDIFNIEGFKKLDQLCTGIAVTQDLKYILNTDSCDYYQFKKFNKQDILDMIDDLVEITDKMRD